MVAKARPDRLQSCVRGGDSLVGAIPRDSLFSHEQWLKIREALCPGATAFEFKESAYRISVAATRYWVNAVEECPPLDVLNTHNQKVGLPLLEAGFYSSENRKKLKYHKKIFEGIKSLFLESDSRYPTTVKRWKADCLKELAQANLRMAMLQRNPDACQNCDAFMNWFKGEETTMTADKFNELADLIAGIFNDNLALLSKAGRKAKTARKAFVRELISIWELCRSEPVKLGCSYDGSDIHGPFVSFVDMLASALAASTPLNDPSYLCSGLHSEIKKIVYPSKKVRS